MFSKRTSSGYKQALKGIRMKTLVFGDKTLFTEFLLDKGSVLPMHAHPMSRQGTSFPAGSGSS